MVETGGFVDMDRATGVFALRLDTQFFVATNTFAWVVGSIVHFKLILKVRDLKG